MTVAGEGCHRLGLHLVGVLEVEQVGEPGVGEGGSATSRQAESLGLIVTELVMNALKHAFPGDKTRGEITVAYEMRGVVPTTSPSMDIQVASNFGRIGKKAANAVAASRSQRSLR